MMFPKLCLINLTTTKIQCLQRGQFFHFECLMYMNATFNLYGEVKKGLSEDFC